MILGLDLGNRTGWAVLNGAGDHVESGVWQFPSTARRWSEFEARLLAVNARHPGAAVVYELVRFHKGVQAGHVFGGYQAILERTAVVHGWTLAYLDVSAIKAATGYGGAKKDAMISAARMVWPEVKLLDDNHADALWVAEAYRKMRMLTEVG